MKVHVLSSFPGPPSNPGNFAFLWLRESAKQDSFGRHELTDDPAEADVILFVENHDHDDLHLLSVRHHPVYKRFAPKCFLYHDSDYALPIVRGIYPSIRKRDYLKDRCRGGPYIARIAQNDAVRYDPHTSNRKWLYSFFGEENSAVRKALFHRRHTEGLVRDTSGKRLWEIEDSVARARFTTEYANSIKDSQFVLCPAGYGPSTFRLFECMEMGRAPVILSDQWVPPLGPRWDDFSVRLPENRVDDIPDVLSKLSGRHEEMGRKARQAWEDWFSKPVCFHRFVELCADIQDSAVLPWSSFRAWSTLLRPPHFKIWLAPHYRKVKKRVRSAIALPKTADGR